MHNIIQGWILYKFARGGGVVRSSLDTISVTKYLWTLLYLDRLFVTNYIQSCIPNQDWDWDISVALV